MTVEHAQDCTSGVRVDTGRQACSSLAHALPQLLSSCSVLWQGQGANVSERCQLSAQMLKERMPEDWDYEEGIRVACSNDAEALCPGVPSGNAQLGRCLR